MAKHLAKCFVDLRRLGIASERIPELTLDHVECGFHVAALVIVLHEAFLIVAVEVEHAIPESGLPLVIPATVGLERDVRHCLIINDGRQIPTRKISLIRAYLLHNEVAARSFH